MTMQVSKGEFDRRVKLLEQKVQESANKLMSDYKTFVERVNAVVSENGDFNQYAAIVDRINSCFDTNGQFDGSHIAPLSIETAALSVGQRSQALNLKNVKFEVKEYKRQTTNPNEDNYNNYGVLSVTDEDGDTSGNGTLTHYTLFNDINGHAIGDAVFNIAYCTKNLVENVALQYIYAKLQCTKADDGTYVYDGNNPSATIEVDVNQKTIEGGNTFTGYLWILLGTISKEFSGERDGVNYIYRIVDLNYGLTTINGRLITTGRIKGTDNDSAYFDLDEGEIGGNIKFTAGNTSALSNYIETSKTEILYKDSKEKPVPQSHGSGSSIYYTIDTTGWQSDRTGLSNAYYITISYKENWINGGRRYSSITVSEPTKYIGDVIIESDVYFISNKIRVAVSGGAWNFSDILSNSDMSSTVCYYRKTSSTTPSGWYNTTKNNINYLINVNTSYSITSYTSNIDPNIYDDDTNYLNKWNLQLCSPSEDYFCIYKGRIRYKKDDNNNILVEEIYDVKLDGNATSDAIALKGTTSINGGLILSQKIKCGENNSTAGISGVGDYAFWAGSASPTDSTNYWVKKDGSAKFGNLKIGSEGLLTFLNSNFYIKNETFDFENFFNDDYTGQHLTLNMNNSSFARFTKKSTYANKITISLYNIKFYIQGAPSSVATNTDWGTFNNGDEKTCLVQLDIDENYKDYSYGSGGSKDYFTITHLNSYSFNFDDGFNIYTNGFVVAKTNDNYQSFVCYICGYKDNNNFYNKYIKFSYNFNSGVTKTVKNLIQ